MIDWLSRVFLKLLLHLVTAVEREVSILLRGKPKEQVQHATKISQADLSSTQLVRAKSTERQAHRPQLKFLTQPVPQTVVQLHRIDNSKKPEPVTRHIFGLFDFFFQICHFWVISDVQWWKQISTHFSDSTHQEYMIFARIGHGPCYYHWNEIFAVVNGDMLPIWIFDA